MTTGKLLLLLGASCLTVVVMIECSGTKPHRIDQPNILILFDGV